MYMYSVTRVLHVPLAAFEEAKKKAPAIIFIDELDAIAPKRDKVCSVCPAMAVFFPVVIITYVSVHVHVCNLSPFFLLFFLLDSW